MLALQNAATVNIIKQTSTTVGATATGTVDTLGFDHIAVDFWNDSAANATNNPAAMYVQEADTTDASNFANITGAVGDATDGFTIGAVSTSVPTVHRVNLGLKGRKRYLRVGISPGGATTILGCTAVLSRAEDSTVAAAKMGTFASVA